MLVMVIRVVLAEDNVTVRDGIKRLLNRANDIEVVGEASNGVRAIELVDQLSPDVLLLDVEMPQMSGIAVARELKKNDRSIPVLVLSAYDELEYIQEMLASGVAGYLIKDEAPDRILDAVRGVAVGEVGWVSPQVKSRLSSSK